MRRGSPWLGVLGLVVACGSGARAFEDGGGGSPGPSPSGASTTPGLDATSSPDGGTSAPAVCASGEALCLAKDRAHACVGGQWVDTTCAAGSGCFQGACTPNACSDECTLGDSSGGKSCGPWSVAAGAAAASDPANKLHDRARGYLGWMKKGPMAAGSIGGPRYADATWATITFMDDLGDSALWTGAYLASQALRLKATGSADARAKVRDLVGVVHTLMTVSGEPGVLARYAKPSSTTYPYTLGDLDCAQTETVHCGIDAGGAKWDYAGHISRDQYQGVILGYSLAYEALTSADEDLRETIRGDVVGFVRELMKERMLPLAVTYSGIALPVTTVPVRFMVVDPREMTGGQASIEITPSGSDKVGAMYGFQEFTPDLSDILKHLPGIGAIGGALPLPRASSAIMLASFFRVALEVTDGVAAHAADHADVLAYYTGHTGEGGNVSDWLGVASGWSTTDDCGSGYYANDITMMPMFDLARLEDDPARAAEIKTTIFGGKLWPAFASTKNSFFSFLYAGAVAPADGASIGANAASQLAGFPVAPRVHHPTDLTTSTKYPTRDPSCTNEVSHDGAVDVGDRVVSDFLWQRDPWELYDPGNALQVHPGVDYLIAYFLGLREGFIADDTPGTCLVFE